MPPPTAISIDVETFGKCDWLPKQTCFNPRRMAFVDGVAPPNQLITCAITPLHNSPPSTSDWNVSSLAAIYTGPTFVLPFNKLPASKRKHPTLSASAKTPPSRSLAILAAYLGQAHTLVGMNIAFDIAVLRAHSPVLRHLLNRRHLLIDLSVTSFLECDTRPERSLKSLSPLLGTASYDPDEKATRYSDPLDLFEYNGLDTHTTALDTAILAGRILANHGPSTAKLSPYCLRTYSDTIWDCIEMSEAGVPFHRPSLEAKARHLTARTARCLSTCAKHGLFLKGDSSQKTQDSFLKALFEAAQATTSTSLADHPSLVLTETAQKLSVAEANRDFLSSFLPRRHPLSRLSRIWNYYVHDSKLLGTYLYPLLWHQGTKAEPKKGRVRTSLLVPLALPAPLPVSPIDALSNPAPSSDPTPPSKPAPSLDPDVHLSHPSWYVVPTHVKDDSGPSGGTLQSRITCKNAAHQTDPKPIEALRRSRFRKGHLFGLDLSQIELRVPALICGEPFFLNAFTQGHDLHARAALRIWGPSLLERYPSLQEHPIDKWKLFSSDFDSRERQVGKRVNFAHLFRSGAPTMQASIYNDIGELLPLSLFEVIVRNRATDLPVLWEWQESLISTARTTGHIALPFTGQSRSFIAGTKYDISEIVNFPVQTTASNVLRRFQSLIHTLIHKHAQSDSILPFLNVYDAIKFDCASPSAVRLLQSKILPEAHHTLTTSDYWHMLQQHFGRTVPLKYDCKCVPPLPT